MVGADLARVVLAASLVLVQHHVGAIYAIAFGMAAATVFFNPAAASVLPGLVDEDELVAANSGIWTAAVLSQILLAPLAAGIVETVGFGPAFVVNACSFAVSALALRRLPAARMAAPVGSGRWLPKVREGVRHLLGDRLLRALATAQLLAALSAGATSALLVVLAREHFRTGSGGFGLLLGAIGVGAAIGPLLLTRVLKGPRHPGVVFGAFGVRGAVDLALASSRALPVGLTAVAIYGVGTSTGSVTFNSLVQATVPEQLRGRVFAGFDLLWQLGRLASLVIGGVLADALGIRAVYYLGGVLLLVAAAVGLTARGRS
jgi:predicted MFS family arabinose efflux permease